MSRLTAEVALRNRLHNDLSRSMYDLYTKYYEATTWDIFFTDLSHKDYVILLWDEQQQVQGFSTLAVLKFEFEGQPSRAIFSGDTIINHLYWGEQTLPLTWCRLAGQIKAEASELPLYWFLIVKGCRTYRYLPVFAKSFYPNWRYPTPTRYQALMDYLAHQKFGDNYHPESGLIQFPTSQGHLREDWAQIKPVTAKKSDVCYFLERNPEYYKGHELVCLMELSEENMRSHARRGFLEGLKAAPEKAVNSQT